MKRLLAMCTFFVLLLLAIWQLGQAGLLAAKAWAAPILIEDAWERQIETGYAAKAWPWADSYPVAKLSFSDREIERFILSGDNMRNLAFGPAMQGNAGQAVIFGHKDTHFRFLESLLPNEVLSFETVSSETKKWTVVQTQIMNVDEMYFPADPENQFMMLVTCYPFGTLDPDTDKRFVVFLQPVG